MVASWNTGGASNLLGPLLEIGAIRVVGDEDRPGVGQESRR